MKREEVESSKKDNDAAASVRRITRENARLGVGAIKTQSRESRNKKMN